MAMQFMYSMEVVYVYRVSHVFYFHFLKSFILFISLTYAAAGTLKFPHLGRTKYISKFKYKNACFLLSVYSHTHQSYMNTHTHTHRTCAHAVTEGEVSK